MKKTTPRPHYEANTQQEAWNIVNQIFPGDYDYDADASSRCGYPVWTSTRPDATYAHISDLNTRLEVCYDNGDCVNIWFTDLYWNAIENEELKKENKNLLKKYNEKRFEVNRLRDTVKARDAEIEGLMKAVKALQEERDELKKNGYSLVNDLIA